MAQQVSPRRPSHLTESSDTTLVVSSKGRRLGRNHLSQLVRKYVLEAGVVIKGSCHLLRRTAATLMMRSGADILSLSLYLSHTKITTTQIYMHVTIQRLKEVHAKTHPAKPNQLAGDPTQAPEGQDAATSADNV